MTVRRGWKILCSFCFAVTLFCTLTVTVFAEGEYRRRNPQTGYEVIIYDAADLLTESEEQKLAEKMEPITAYGGVCFYTLDQNNSSARKAAEKAYLQYFENNSGVLFLIDMDHREIWMSANGEIYKVVTSSYCTTITDNVYRFASKGDYYGCAEEAFSEVYTLLSGQKIAQPMKYISNFLLAAILSVLVNFIFVMKSAKKWKKSAYGSDAGVAGDVEVLGLTLTKTGTTKEYSPVSSDSGSSSSGGGGGGGGGFSGGGGGHSF